MTKEQIDELATQATQEIISDTDFEKLKATLSEFTDYSRYYYFLYLLAKAKKPKLVVELGVNIGTSAICLAAGMGNKGRLIAVDHSKQPQIEERLLVDYPQVEFWQMNSHSGLEKITEPIDILFMDTSHEYNTTIGEYNKAKPIMADGGVICVDDIDCSPDMKRFWAEVDWPKYSYPALHTWYQQPGFGIILKP